MARGDNVIMYIFKTGFKYNHARRGARDLSPPTGTTCPIPGGYPSAGNLLTKRQTKDGTNNSKCKPRQHALPLVNIESLLIGAPRIRTKEISGTTTILKAFPVFLT